MSSSGIGNKGVDEERAKVIEFRPRANARNIAALVEYTKHQAKEIEQIKEQLLIQARSIQTLSNELTEMRKSFGNVAATMGTGPTVK